MRAAEVVALQQIASNLGEVDNLFLGLDTFGNNCETELVGDDGDRFDEGLATLVVREAPHE